ncbi:MAG TPA: elongation factor G [Acholeplasmataceae bacterium]|jgi:elongation factor G|nr:elongation factor G [Acholeplasmataceae bacterium]
MKDYQSKEIRNIVIIGHQGSGKTTLTESMLYVAKNISKKGEVDKKNTVSDFLPEEQQRLSSLSTSIIPVEYNGYKLNFLDTPGNDEFVGELNQALSVVKGAVILVDATSGVQVGTERVWKEVRKKKIPTVIFINKMDKENVNFDNVLKDIEDKLGKEAVPFAIPIGKEDKFEGYVDVVDLKGYVFDASGRKEVEVYADNKARAEELNTEILEAVASTSEELLELYFSGEEISQEQIAHGLKNAMINGELAPIMIGSAAKDIGIQTLLDMMINYLPSPDSLKPLKGKDPRTNAEVVRNTNDKDPFSAYVFKSSVDPFLGVINYLKVNSGTLTSGQDITVTNRGESKKVGALFALRGKTQISVDTVHAGDIVAVNKLDLFTGDTLSDPRNQVLYEPVPIVTPVIYVAIVPKNRQDEDKISGALQRLNLEDPTFEIRRNKETSQLLVGGQGMTHLGYILDKMKSMFKVDVEIEDQKIVYRETITRKVEAEGKHKKQSGGAGQYGHVFIRFEPSEQIFEFHEEIFGGSVPKNYHPAVEKGLQETFERGPLAGFPVVQVKATLYDGSYHSVDSNEISFKLAAALAFRDAVAKGAGATILEPIMSVSITVKDQFVGDVMGDVNKRRGRVLGMDQGHGEQIIHTEIPEAEIVSYAIDLKAMTQGSGTFTREFLRYEQVPAHLIDKIIEEYKK